MSLHSIIILADWHIQSRWCDSCTWISLFITLTVFNVCECKAASSYACLYILLLNAWMIGFTYYLFITHLLLYTCIFLYAHCLYMYITLLLNRCWITVTKWKLSDEGKNVRQSHIFNSSPFPTKVCLFQHAHYLQQIIFSLYNLLATIIYSSCNLSVTIIFFSNQLICKNYLFSISATTVFSLWTG